MIRTDTRLFPILFAALGLAVGLFAFIVWPAYAKEGSAPAKPTGLSATASHDQVTLTWDDPGDDSITGYVILRRNRDDDPKGHFDELVENTGTAATTHSDDSVKADTTYTYRIKAINQHGVSKRSRWFHIDTPAAPEPVNSPATGAPAISGTVQMGEELTAGTSGIADEDGLENATFGYQWLAGDSDIAGAAGPAYTLADTDEGKTVRVRVSFTDDAGNDETLTSEATAEVEGRPNSPATGAPAITGTVQVGETLGADTTSIADEEGLENAAFSYQWLAEESGIPGATARTHTLSNSDEGKAIKVKVSFTDDAGNDEELTSAATGAVAAGPSERPAQPTGLSATSTHDQVTLTWDDPQDDSVTGYVILRRLRYDDPSGHFDELAADTGTAATTYTDDTVAAETSYTYRIKATNGAGPSKRSRWSHINTPAAPDPETDPADLAPSSLAAELTSGQVVLTWDSPAEDAASVTGYEILRGEGEDDPATLAADTGSAAATYTDATATTASESYAYSVKAIRDGERSQASNEAVVQLPPAAPTGVLSAAAHDRVLLSWNDPQDSATTGYRILRASIVDGVQGEFAVLIEDTGNADTSYTDETVEPECSYVYRVHTISPHGVSAPSSDRRVNTPAAPTVVTPEPPDVVPPITERANVEDLGDITEQDGPQVIHDGLEGAADAADYYRFTLSEPRLVRLGLPWQEGDAVLVLELEDSTRLRVGAPDGDAHASVEETLLEGTHYARVEAQQQGENEYVFSYEVSAADPAEAARLREEGYTPDPEPGEDTEPLVGLPAETIQPRQEAEVLLSNFGQVQSSSGLIIRDSEVAQGFTTGPNIPGYTLGSIELDVYGIPETPTEVTVALWSATNDGRPKPNAPVATLTHSTGTWTAGPITFDAPAGTELAGDTTFFVFVSYPSTGAVDQILLRRINETSADAGGAPGWRISRSFSRERTPQGDWSGISITMKIRINGNQVLGPSSGDRPGTVVLSAAEPFSASQPYVGVRLTAALDDPDIGPVTALKWQWSRSINGTDWTDINGATSSSYTPVAFTPADLDDDIAPQEDEGRYLRATASYRQTFSDRTVDQTAHGSTGAHVKFDISEPPGADFSDGSQTPGRVRVGGWVRGASVATSTTGPQDYDYFRVDLAAGRKYRVDVEGRDTGQGTLEDPELTGVYFYTNGTGSEEIVAGSRDPDDSGKGKNDRGEFVATRTQTHVIFVTSEIRWTAGTYKVTVQEILDDLGVWHTDWGAEEPGGFLQPNNQANGNLYGADATQRSGGQRDKDAFLFYLGSDKAPLDTDYVLAVRGLDTPQLQVETFYDLSGLDAYIEKFSLADDFIEFPESGSGNPDPDVSDAEAGRLRSVVPRPVGTLVGTSREGEFHLVFNPGAEDLGAYLAVIKSHRKNDTGDYQLHLRQDDSVSEPDGEDFANDHRTKGYVRVGDPVTGHIGDHGADVDSFATLLEGGRTYRIEAKGSETGDGTLDDPTISNIENHWPDLLTACGGSTPQESFSACSDDDGGQGLNASVVFSPESTGLYYVVITNEKAALNGDFSLSQEGTYTLSVTDVTDIPRIVAEGVRVTSSPASGDTYGDGEDIEITVTFSEAVVVSGSPQFEFCMGSGECRDGDDPPARRRARLTSGSGGAELVFTYRVGSDDDPDNDGDGIWIGDHTRTLQLDAGDAIRDVATGTDAILNHDALGTQSGHKVDTG